MAKITRNKKRIDLKAGTYKGKIINYIPKGKKKIRDGEFYNQGYLDIELENGTIVNQYVLVVPWKNFILNKLVQAIKPEMNLNEEYLDFNFYELINKEVFIEIEYEFNGVSTYSNITEVYNMEDGIEMLQHQKMVDEYKKANGNCDMHDLLQQAEAMKPASISDFNYGYDSDDELIEF